MSHDIGTRTDAWRIIGAWFLGGLFLVAATSKVVGIASFRLTVDALLVSVLPASISVSDVIRTAFALVVIVSETAIGAWILMSVGRSRAAPRAAAVLLGAFSTVLMLMLFMDNPPSCGCLGSWKIVHADARMNAALGLARNAMLIVLSIWLSREANVLPSLRFRRASAPSAFTLVETLFVIAVIGLLIGLLAPALGKIRAESKSTQSLSALRQSYVGIQQYADGERGYFPFLGVPFQPELGTLPDREWTDRPPEFFIGQAYWWPTALYSLGIDLSLLPRNWRHDLDDTRIGTYVWLTHSACARPEYWVGIDPRPRTGSSTAFDSTKRGSPRRRGSSPRPRCFGMTRSRGTSVSSTGRPRHGAPRAPRSSCRVLTARSPGGR